MWQVRCVWQLTDLNFQIATDFSDDHPFSPSLHVGRNSVGDKNQCAERQTGRNSDFANETTAEKIDILSRVYGKSSRRIAGLSVTSANRHVRINEQLKRDKKSSGINNLKPALLAQDKQGFYSVSSRYIEDVNDFVGELQYRNEQRQTWQQNLQILSLLLIAIIVLIGMRRLQKSILLPIQQLIKANNQFKRGQTQTRVSHQGLPRI